MDNNHSNNLNSLLIFEKDELFYKEYYEAKKDSERLEAFKKKYSYEYITNNSLICPDIVEEISQLNTLHYNEQYIFDKIHHKQQVVLFKHPRYTPEFIHSHDYFELFYVLTGSCRHTINNVTSILNEGTLFFIAPYTNHSIGVFDDDSIVMNILIKKNFFKDFFLSIISIENIISEFFLSNIFSQKKIESLIFYDIGEDLKAIIKEMLNEQNSSNDYYSDILNHLLVLFFFKLLRSNKNYCDIKIISKLDSDRALKMLAYIYDNYNQVTLESLSTEFNYSVEHCSRIIKKELGKTFSTLVKEIRLSKAKDYLLYTPMSVESICYEVGYDSLSSFQRLFKKYYNLTPGLYREKNQLINNK